MKFFLFKITYHAILSTFFLLFVKQFNKNAD